MSSVHPPITKLDFMGSNLDPFQISAISKFGLDVFFSTLYMNKTLENKSKGKKQ